jgi:cytochrome c biogenesis protein
MRYKGFRFYQTSFDTERPRVLASIDSALMTVERVVDEAVLDTLVVSLNEALDLPNGRQLVMTRFLPDFRLSGSSAVSASGELKNPAVLFEVRNAGEELYHQWSFLKNPFGHVPQGAEYTFQALDIYGFKSDVTYATILEVNKNPGYWLIWIGFALATLGLILAFYLVPKRIWVTIKEEGEGQCQVSVGGYSRKGKDMFSRWFDGWAQRLESRSS